MRDHWQNKSVLNLINEYKYEFGSDPVKIIKSIARDLVLKAHTKGWSGPPFDIIELTSILGIEVMPNDLVIDARILSKSKGKFLVEYNPFQNPARINFSLAHEIGHSLFSDCSETIRYRSKAMESDSWELEFLCNIAAAEILLPYSTFYKEANSLPLHLDSLKVLAEKYRASLEAVFIRFCEVADKPCMILLTEFTEAEELSVQYAVRSQSCEIELKKDKFIIPKTSKAYECIKAGWTSHQMEEWEIFDGGKCRIFSIGLPPVRKHTEPRVGILIVPEIFDPLSPQSLYLVNGDATMPRGEGNKIIAQIVNTSAGSGFGFGKAMATKYPLSKKALTSWKDEKDKFVLGNTQLVKLEDDLWVFQIIAQEGIFPKHGKIPLKYDCLRKGLIELGIEAKQLNASVHMPKIGAGQAKGDWNIIEGMIHQELVRNGIEVSVYVMPGSRNESKVTIPDLFNQN